MPFNTANSSFIFDLRRLSMRLCAVFLAIFRPAALVADGCFLLVAGLALEAAGAAVAAPFFAVAVDLELAVGSAGVSSCGRGFIWMILRDRVGGGGRAKASLAGPCAAEDLRRDFTVSLACRGYAVLGDDWGLDDAETFVSELAGRDSAGVIAGGGSSKAICRAASCFVPSWPGMSVEDAGVGRAVRGIVWPESKIRSF
jgi:hypothetical protein